VFIEVAVKDDIETSAAIGKLPDKRVLAAFKAA